MLTPPTLALLLACASPSTDGSGAGTDSAEAPDTGPADSGAAETGPWRSALYPEDWTPGFSVDAGDGGGPAYLHDFSWAGYRAGEAALPTVDSTRAVSVLDHGADPTGQIDSTAAFQAALDAGAGGAVLVPAGDYRVDDLLTVSTSGTVLAGEGPDLSRIHFTRAEAMTDRAHLTFAGSPETGEVLPLAVDGEVLTTTVQVEDVGELAAGDRVSLGWTVSEDWVLDHGMDGYWEFSLGQWRPFFRREVVAVDAASGTVTLDVPLRYPALVRDGAGLRPESGQLTDCGVDGLGLSTAVDRELAWTQARTHALAFKYAEDCWVRDVASWEGLTPEDTDGDHLLSGGIRVEASRRVTIADTELERAQNRGESGNGYLFELRQSGEVLVRDSVGRDGRHNFIQNWDFGTSGCVFLRVRSEGSEAWTEPDGGIVSRAASEYHHALAMANLVDDSDIEDGWQAVNRLFWSSGAGHTATGSTFWNLRGDGLLLSYQYDRGYVVGTTDLDVRTEVTDVYESSGTAPEDWAEGLGRGADLEPRSLYEDQLARRLGG